MGKTDLIPFSEVLEYFDNVTLVKMNCEGCKHLAILSTPSRALRRVRAYIVQAHRAYGDPKQLMYRLRKSRFKMIVRNYEWFLAVRA